MNTDATPRLLKADALRGSAAGIAFNYADIEARCREHLDNVRRQTREMIQQATADAEAIRQQAELEGSEVGYREGMNRAQEQIDQRARQLSDEVVSRRLQTTLPALQSAAEALQRERDQWIADWETVAVQLSVRIAERIIREQIAVRPQIAVQSLREALELAAGTPRMTIRMHPADLAQLGEQPERFFDGITPCAQVACQPDPGMTPGGCMIETEHGIVDGRVETQLARITAELLDHQEFSPKSAAP